MYNNKVDPRVAIIIINWNGWKDTIECLDSLKNLNYNNYRVIVVDNHSKNNEANRLKEKYVNYITLIENKENYGFCKGNNIGINFALKNNFEYFLLLNNDTTTEPNFLLELIKTAQHNNKIGIIGPRIILYYDHSKLDSIGGHVNLWFGYEKSFKKPYCYIRDDLNFISGCAFLIRREVVKQVGFLDEDYFSYWEETDYCIRANRNNWLIACNPQSIIYHKVGMSFNYLSNTYIYYMVRNGLLFMKKNCRWFQLPTFFLFFSIKYIIGYSFYLIIKRPQHLFVVRKAIHDFLRNNYGRKINL